MLVHIISKDIRSYHVQVRLIRLNTLGFMLSQLCCLAGASLLLPALEWRGLYKQVILSAVSSVLVSVFVLIIPLLMFVASISGLASQQTARRGNILGILGVAAGIIASLAAVGFSPEVLTQFGAVAGLGSIAGM